MNDITLLPAWRLDLEILLQSVVALVLGGVIGWEREQAGKWAGLRTHMLVCLASMLFVRVGELMIATFNESLAGELLRADPVRLAR